MNHPQAESRVQQGIFLYVIPVRMLGPLYYGTKKIEVISEKRDISGRILFIRN